ncbi:hypothetical protein [Saccharolobus shibatae]|uniref:Uncharacterized protein n=2 Tax=Saccharolobus shibatae TaxID=2286 RepID=A0A8F5BL01_SACSH|nr:hypothetical protein [Saccharolobus shibatae]QXJ27100.1 hypothetical protein J5U23_p2882 [Saccharolobus shibatae B12]QXJ29993.1 hypothetical protein J5U23_02882 [Saccharolobus shibatae B12]QXJ30317.1 hypothetical protein J5U21_p0059 [Saccharolobus shibatae]QXJ30419.1 hypothetical protein J5U21_00059 [Saccharolobus shibatae]
MIFKKKNEGPKLSERVQLLMQRFEESIRANDNARTYFYYQEIMELIKAACDEE